MLFEINNKYYLKVNRKYILINPTSNSAKNDIELNPNNNIFLEEGQTKGKKEITYNELKDKILKEMSNHSNREENNENKHLRRYNSNR